MAKALGRLASAGNEAVLSALLATLRDDDHWVVRMEASAALGKLASADNEAVVSALLAALQDRDKRVRVSAAEALDQLGFGGNEAVLGILHAALRSARDSLERNSGLTVRSNPGSPWNDAMVNALLASTRDSKLTVRVLIAVELHELGFGGNEAVLGILHAALRSARRVHRNRALGVLSNLGSSVNEAVVSAVFDIFRDGDLEDCWKARLVLSRMMQSGLRFFFRKGWRFYKLTELVAESTR